VLLLTGLVAAVRDSISAWVIQTLLVDCGKKRKQHKPHRKLSGLLLLDVLY